MPTSSFEAAQVSCGLVCGPGIQPVAPRSRVLRLKRALAEERVGHVEARALRPLERGARGGRDVRRRERRVEVDGRVGGRGLPVEVRERRVQRAADRVREARDLCGNKIFNTTSTCEFFGCASRTRREKSTRPKNSHIDFDLTEL